MYRTEEGWMKAYMDKDALWVHSGNPLRPHALLTSGNHSSGFCNSRPIISDLILLGEAASDLVERFASRDIPYIIVGPQTGATKLAELISIEFSVRGMLTSSLSPAKHEEDGRKSMVFTSLERALLDGKDVLLCEDVITTGGSVERTAEAVEEAGGVLLPFILTLVNRSGKTMIDGKEVIALINREMPVWTPDECPLCAGGSQAIRPKDNWKQLTT